LVVWILTTENPVCINVFIDSDSIQKSQTYVSRIQILGAAPPEGVLIDLNGILRTGNTANFYAVPNTITVISGTKVRKNGADITAAAPPVEVIKRDDVEIKPKKTVNRGRESETKEQAIPKSVTDALQKAKQMALLFKVENLEIEFDDTPGASGYSIYLHYGKNVFTSQRTRQETVIAFDNDYNLAREFVKQLINSGLDPAVKSSSRYVEVCSVVDGTDAATKNPDFELIGCARYNPEKDTIDPDFIKISDPLPVAKRSEVP